MNLRSLAVVICSLFILNSCGSGDPTEKLVKEYIAQSEGIDAGSIKILELEDAAPWLATDSLKILSEILATEKEEIVGHLKAAIEASKKAIEHAEEVKTSGFPALAEVAEVTIAESMETIELAKEKLKMMDGDLAGTALEALNNRVEKFRSFGDDLLYQVLKGKWSGADEQEHDFHLIAKEDLSEIIGKFGE